MDSLEEIKQTFFIECEEQLADLESGLLAMEEGRTDLETVNAVFRSVHSIKGGAGAFKLAELVQFSHSFETVLDHIRSQRLDASPGVLRVLLRAADCLSDLVDSAKSGRPGDQEKLKPVAEELAALAELTTGEQEDSSAESVEIPGFTPLTLSFDDAPEAAQSGHQTYRIRFAPRPQLYANANDAVPILRELARLGAVSTSIDATRLPTLDGFDPLGSYLEWNIELQSEADMAAVREVFEFVEPDCELEISVEASAPAFELSLVSFEAEPAATVGSAPPPPVEATAAAVSEKPTARVEKDVPATATSESSNGSSAASAGQPTIRVDFERVDRLINLVGELVINQAVLSQRIYEVGISQNPSVEVGLDELEQLTREIQESVMAIRAQPVRPLFQRMSRIARECADATGKLVRLRTEGESTEIDKTLVERLAEPLTHMIRNAIDHGIESPEKRAAAGKSAEGVVKLSAGHKSGRIVIEVADDGGGINRQRVKDIAISKGLIPPDIQLSDAEIDNLLFLPGFSTASTVSNISGRGVGMDVVKRAIQLLGGRIAISSTPGEGSVFSLSLPLTLAVLDGMVVMLDGQTFVVPLTSIVETIKPSASSLYPLGSDARIVAIRDTVFPLVDVGHELGIRAPLADASEGEAIVVETEIGARYALLFDCIQDQRQVVIKSLEANYRHIAGIAAATILGDGRVALILDVDTLVAGRSGDGPLAAMPKLETISSLGA